VRRRQALLAAARADRIPDLSVAGGVRQFAETDDHAFVVGVAMPLPVLNRNQGAIRECAAQLAKVEQEQRAAESAARTGLVAAQQTLASATAKAGALEQEIVPASQNVLTATKAGYTQGKFSYLDVLEAQRAFFEAKAVQLDALAECHAALVDVERLTGGRAGEPAQTTTK
jgi:outer membrane protein, heavy metal efflux system